MPASSVAPVREVFTTGQVAHACRISIGVVIRAFDAGLLGGYLLPPDRKIRRFTRGQVERFQREQKLPFTPDGDYVDRPGPPDARR